MVALSSRPSLNLPLAPLAASITGALVLLAIAIAPADLIERAVVATGLPAWVPAAAPPLGLTARAALVFLAACAMGGAAWALNRTGFDWGLDRRGKADVPSIRRADAHPDAPARAPVLAARDLGQSSLADLDRFDAEPASERTIPADLDTPLAAIDPASVRPVPLPAPEPVRALAPMPRTAEPQAQAQRTAEPQAQAQRTAEPLAENERIETFELTPPARAPFVPILPDRPEEAIAAPETDATIHALLVRLERGVERRRQRPAPPHIHAALATLRHAVGA